MHTEICFGCNTPLSIGVTEELHPVCNSDFGSDSDSVPCKAHSLCIDKFFKDQQNFTSIHCPLCKKKITVEKIAHPQRPDLKSDLRVCSFAFVAVAVYALMVGYLVSFVDQR